MLQIFLAMLETNEEKERFEQFYYKYRKLMLYTAYGILNDSGRAEHAVQEAFIRCAKNFQKISDIFCPQTRAFAVIITKNEALRNLRYYNDFSMNEIASALGITVETAKKRAQRALAMLRSMSESNA